MSHEIELSANGTHSFISSANRIAWHALGQYSGEESLYAKDVVVGANLGFQVDKSPAMIYVNGQVIPNEGKFDLYRTDTNVAFGQVTDQYKVLQNTDAFQFFDNIVGSKQAIYQTAGVLGKGERVFITAKMPNHIRIAGTDDLTEVYVVLTNSHDGNSAVRVMITPVRVVCANTLRMAISGARNSVSIQHSQKMDQRMADAEKVLGITNKYVEEANELLNFAATQTVSDVQARSIINELFIPKASQGLELDDLHGKTTNILDAVWESYQTGAGQEGIVGSAYGLYNGITHYLDHGKAYRTDEARFNNVMGGTSYNLANASLKLMGIS